ncbi:MAG TPA: SgcJ/EcaC family oxidoreductase [Candidatus Binatia bacterium]
MTSAAQISHKSWAALALSAAVLLVFAIVVTQQIGERPAKKEAVQSDRSLDKPLEVTEQAKDVAPQAPKSDANTDAGLESTVEQLVQAWNQGDANKIAQLFLPDGVLRLPTGSEIKSREEIKNTIAKHQSGMLKETTLTNDIEGVSTDGDNAVVKGSYQLDGIKVLGFNASSAGSYEFQGIKRNGRWLIAKADVTRE